MSKAVKIILGILVFGIVLVAVCVGAGYSWLQSHKGELMADAERTDKEARLFAQDRAQDACLDEALRRIPAARGIMDQAMLKIFLQKCLTYATASPDLCKAVPGRANIMKSATWALGVCEARGLQGSQPCAQLVQGLNEHCEKHPARE